MSVVLPPETTGFLAAHLRALAEETEREVDFVEEEPPSLELPLQRPLVVLRDDGGRRIDHVTFDRSIGVRVRAGSRVLTDDAVELSRWLAGVLFDPALALVEGSPIASVEWDGCNGPYAVTDELDVACRYLTAQYRVVGSW